MTSHYKTKNEKFSHLIVIFHQKRDDFVSKNIKTITFILYNDANEKKFEKKMQNNQTK